MYKRQVLTRIYFWNILGRTDGYLELVAVVKSRWILVDSSDYFYRFSLESEKKKSLKMNLTMKEIHNDTGTRYHQAMFCLFEAD